MRHVPLPHSSLQFPPQTDNGGAVWTYAGDTTSDIFGVTMARHANTSAPNAVDTFGVETSSFASLGTCTVYGWSSFAGASSTPAWSHSYDLCSSNLFTGGSYVSVEASDSGGVLVALLDMRDSPTANVTAHAYVFDGPTGTLNFVRDLSVPASQGQEAGGDRDSSR